MCTNALGGFNGNARDFKQRAAFKILARSSVERQNAFALERGWHHLDFIQTVSDDYALDHGALNPATGDESPAYIVFRKDADQNVRYFYALEMPAGAADPGQDPRGAVDFAPLWNVLDTTPEGRGEDWYPKLEY